MTTAQTVHTQVDKQTVSLAQPPAPTQAQAQTDALTVQQVLGQVALIQQVMAASMKDGEHYGKIPGCGDKPTLLKPGAEKLCLTFRMAPFYEVKERQLEHGHREYRVTTTLNSILSGVTIGQGVGACSSMEGKYRFRQGAAEPTDKPVPRAYWDLRQEDPAKAQDLIGGKGFTVKKVEGQGWMIAKGGDKVEHDNPADHYNTVLKMAKKRALVDAVLTATAASDIFTQDLEDIRANLELATAAAAIPAAATPANLAPVPSLTLPPIPAEPTGPATPPPQATAEETAETPDETTPAEETEPFEFRCVDVPFGKNEGVSLGMLTPQQIHWYETEWMPGKESLVNLSAGKRLFIRGLKAYRADREAEKRRAEEALAAVKKPRRARRQRASAAATAALVSTQS